MNDIINALSVDVEDYFQVSAFEKHISRDKWNSISVRVEGNMERILNIFEEYDAKATFFTLGWIAEKYPSMINKISDAGHEIASHGYSHIRVTEQSKDEFKNDISKTKNILEDITGNEVLGYRAASFSITKECAWAHNIIEGCGYSYSSSIYPIKHDLYGIPDAPRHPYLTGMGQLLEIPVTTFEIMGQRIPCGGGGFFRFYPYFISKYMFKTINKNEMRPCLFYFHPWELDKNQPKQKNISFKTRFRHYLNLGKMEKRLRSLLQDFKWGRYDQIFLEKNN